MGYGFRTHRTRNVDVFEPALGKCRKRRLLRYSNITKPKHISSLVYEDLAWKSGESYRKKLSQRLRELAQPSRVHVPSIPASIRQQRGDEVILSTQEGRDSPSDTGSEPVTNDSLASLDPDDPATGQHEVLTILADLVVQDRIRRRCHAALQTAETELAKLEDVLGKQRRKVQQLRKNQNDNRDLINEYNAARKIAEGEHNHKLEQVLELAKQMREAHEEQSRLEPQLYRTARSFLINVGAEGDDEDGLSPDFQAELLLVADMGRNLLRQSRQGRVTRNRADLARRLKMRESSQRDRAARFYRDFAEPWLVENKVLPEETAGDERASQAGAPGGREGRPRAVAQQPNAGPEAEALRRDLREAREDLDRRYARLWEVRSDFARDLERALLADRRLSKEAFGTRWLTTTFARATDGIRQAEAKVNELVAQAKAAGLIRSPGQGSPQPGDGHNSRAGTEWEDGNRVRGALHREEIEHWLDMVLAEKKKRLADIRRGVPYVRPAAPRPQDVDLPACWSDLRPMDSYSSVVKPSQHRGQIDDWQMRNEQQYVVSRQERRDTLARAGWPVAEPQDP